MKNNESVQSLTRGLEILRLLSVNKRMAATEIATHLGLHQSSASRLLRSMEQAGFVYKPDFRSFALDYGVLVFADAAINGFREIGACARVCARLHEETGYGVAAGTIFRNRLVYFARIGAKPDAVLVLADNSDFPLHESSLGLILLHEFGRKTMLAALKQSIARMQQQSIYTPEQLAGLAERNIDKNGFLYLEDFGDNRVNIAGLFSTVRGPAALAFFSGKKVGKILPEKRIPELLRQGLIDIEMEIVS